MKHTVAYYFKNKNVVVTTSGVMSKISFECTKQAFGIDSIIFASDYPYVCLADMMKFVKTLDLTEEEKEIIGAGRSPAHPALRCSPNASHWPGSG